MTSMAGALEVQLPPAANAAFSTTPEVLKLVDRQNIQAEYADVVLGIESYFKPEKVSAEISWNPDEDIEAYDCIVFSVKNSMSNDQFWDANQAFIRDILIPRPRIISKVSVTQDFEIVQ